MSGKTQKKIGKEGLASPAEYLNFKRTLENVKIVKLSFRTNF